MIGTQRKTRILKQGNQYIEEIRKALTISNPNYYNAIKAGAHPYYLEKQGIPQSIKVYTETSTHIEVPRHFVSADKIDGLMSYLGHDVSTSSCVLDKPETLIDIETLPTFEPRKYQVEPIAEMSKYHYDILSSPCGSGKTIQALVTICNVKRRTAIVVNTKFLVEQWKKEILNVTNLAEKDIYIPGNDIKQEKIEKAKISIFMVQTLINRPYEQYGECYNKFGLAIFDETHIFGAFEFLKAVELFDCRRIGLTATVERTDRLRTFQWAIGNRIYKVDYQGLKPIVKMVKWNLTKDGYPVSESDYLTRTGNFNIAMLINIITADIDRTNAIVKSVAKYVDVDNRHIMILTHRRKHAEVLRDLISANLEKVQIPVRLLLGGMKLKNLEEQLKPANEKKGSCIVATFQYARQALDVPHVDTLVLVTPFSNSNDVQQSTGRILRVVDNKRRPLVIDIVDENIGPAKGMAKKRLAAYNKLEYDIDDTV